MSVVRLCAGVEGTLASARAAPLAEEPPSLTQADVIGMSANAQTTEDAVDQLESGDAVTPPKGASAPSAVTPPKPTADSPHKVDEQTGTVQGLTHRQPG